MVRGAGPRRGGRGLKEEAGTERGGRGFVKGAGNKRGGVWGKGWSFALGAGLRWGV